MRTPRSCVNGKRGAAVPQRAARAPFSMQGFFSTGAPTLTNERKTADLPLAVWPCAQRTSQWQRYKRYLPESNRHPGKMLPALARRAIESYSEPGDLVVDPMCGIGTTLVEASDLGRRAVGVELEPRWAKLASANLDHVHADTRSRSLALARARCRRQRARAAPRAHGAGTGAARTRSPSRRRQPDRIGRRRPDPHVAAVCMRGRRPQRGQRTRPASPRRYDQLQPRPSQSRTRSRGCLPTSCGKSRVLGGLFRPV